MYQLTITLTAISTPLRQEEILGRGLSGLLYKRLLHNGRWAKREVDWLHDTQPRPYSMMPIFTNGQLTGIRFGILAERAFPLLYKAWQHAIRTGMLLQLGTHRLVPTYIDCHQGLGFAELQENTGAAEMHLHFATPTTFRKGEDANGNLRFLLLPIPRNVFLGVFDSWQAFAPPPQQLPNDWLTWCDQSTLVSRHQIQSQSFTIVKAHPYIGFVGDVSFKTWDDNMPYRRMWHALGQYATYCGIGAKTAMGLGATTYKAGRG